jgi:hypothetical protein
MDGKLADHVAWPVTMIATLFLSALSPAAFAQRQLSKASDGAAARPSSGVSAGESHGLPEDVLQVLRWLPEDTESITLARGPLQDGALRDFRDDLPLFPQLAATGDSPAHGVVAAAPNPTQQPLPDFRQELLAASAGLFGVSGKAFIRNINDHKVCFVVGAARRLGRPVIGRASTYEGGQIIVFRDAIPDVGVQARAQERLSMVRIECSGVVRLDTEERWGEKNDKVTVYYAKPKTSILIAATDVRFLETMLQRIAQPPVSRTPVLDFPEWKYVDVQAPVWGVRHRRTATPIYILARTGKNGLPFSELSGISFSYESKPATCVAYRFHFTEKAHDAVRQAVAEASGIRLLAPSVVENRMGIRAQATASEPGSGTPADATFMVQHLMGYVVCP